MGLGRSSTGGSGPFSLAIALTDGVVLEMFRRSRFHCTSEECNHTFWVENYCRRSFQAEHTYCSDIFYRSFAFPSEFDICHLHDDKGTDDCRRLCDGTGIRLSVIMSLCISLCFSAFLSLCLSVSLLLSLSVIMSLCFSRLTKAAQARQLRTPK